MTPKSTLTNFLNGDDENHYIEDPASSAASIPEKEIERISHYFKVLIRILDLSCGRTKAFEHDSMHHGTLDRGIKFDDANAHE